MPMQYQPDLNRYRIYLTWADGEVSVSTVSQPTRLDAAYTVAWAPQVVQDYRHATMFTDSADKNIRHIEVIEL